MVINSRQVQTQSQQQVQTLSPQQILVVKLLELPTVELEERIHSELLDNPALEEGKEPAEESEHEDNYEEGSGEEDNADYNNEDLSLGDYRSEDDIPDYKLQENNRSQDDKPEEIPFSDSISFYETLKEQLDMQNLTPEEKQLGEYLIGSLDDDGLLRKSMDTLIDELAIYKGYRRLQKNWNMSYRLSRISTRRESVHATCRSVCYYRSGVKKILRLNR